MQVGQLFLIKREDLNALYSSIDNLLQAIQDINLGIAKDQATKIQTIINSLLPEISANEDIENISEKKKLVKTPVGELDLENSPLGNLINFNKLAEAHTRNSNKRKQKLANKTKS